MSLPADRILDLALRLLLLIAVFVLIAWFQAVETRHPARWRPTARHDHHQQPMSTIRRGWTLRDRVPAPRRIDRRA